MSDQIDPNYTSQVLRYFGGKGSKLGRWIIDHMPKHEAYIEPFFGGGSVFFMKTLADVSVVNDLNSEVMTFYRVMRDKPEELARQLEYTLWGRDEFALAWETCDGCDDVEIARRLAVKAWQGFGHRVGKNYGWHKAFQGKKGGGRLSVSWQSLPQAILDNAHKLKRANIENMDALELIQLYSKPQATQLYTRLFYLDPPYPHDTLLSKHGYGDNDIDHEALLKALLDVPYYVMLSGYENDLYSDMLKDWHVATIDKVDHVRNKATECLWLNPVCYEAWRKERGLGKQLTLFDMGANNGTV
jgi:DNA adenine methylase